MAQRSPATVREAEHHLPVPSGGEAEQKERDTLHMQDFQVCL